MKIIPLVACLAAVLSPLAAYGQTSTTQPGATRVAQWKDDKKSAFMLMFDDACPSQAVNAVPQLKQHGFAATFYPFSGAGHYRGKLSFWEKEVPAIPGFVYGNHTVNHKGFATVADAQKEVADANAVIVRLFPGKNPRLLSYADPGGVKNAISGAEIDAILAKNNLIRRPEFGGHGGGIQYTTAAAVLADADKAIANGTTAYIIFHGVGGDWISFDGGQFVQLLDGLKTRADSLWIADTLSVHKYETERATATVKVLESSPRQIRIQLNSKANPALYDQPLTLLTAVPASWTQCQVVQGTKRSNATIANGIARYEALADAEPIVISPR